MFGSTTEGVLRGADHSYSLFRTSTPPRAEADDLSGIGPVVRGWNRHPPQSPPHSPRRSREAARHAAAKAVTCTAPVRVVALVGDAQTAQRDWLNDARARLREAAARGI